MRLPAKILTRFFVSAAVIFQAIILISLSAMAKSVEIEWEDRPEAVAYEVEIYKKGRKIGTTKSPSKDLKANLACGKYKVRGRIVTRQNLTGDWSELTDFEVPPEPVVPEASATSEAPVTTATANPKTLLAPVNLRWSTSPDAVFYHLIIKDGGGRAVSETRVRRNETKLELPPGAFTYVVKAEGPDGVMGEESLPLGQIEVHSAQLPKPKFQWQVVGRNLKLNWTPQGPMEWMIRVERKAFFSDKWTEVLETQKAAGTSGQWLSPLLLPGLYRLTVFVKAAGWLDSAPVTKLMEIRPTSQDFAER